MPFTGVEVQILSSALTQLNESREQLNASSAGTYINPFRLKKMAAMSHRAKIKEIKRQLDQNQIDHIGATLEGLEALGDLIEEQSTTANAELVRLKDEFERLVAKVDQLVAES